MPHHAQDTRNIPRKPRAIPRAQDKRDAARETLRVPIEITTGSGFNWLRFLDYFKLLLNNEEHSQLLLVRRVTAQWHVPVGLKVRHGPGRAFAQRLR